MGGAISQGRKRRQFGEESISCFVTLPVSYRLRNCITRDSFVSGTDAGGPVYRNAPARPVQRGNELTVVLKRVEGGIVERGRIGHGDVVSGAVLPLLPEGRLGGVPGGRGYIVLARAFMRLRLPVDPEPVIRDGLRQGELAGPAGLG